MHRDAGVTVERDWLRALVVAFPGKEKLHMVPIESRTVRIAGVELVAEASLNN